MPLTKLKFPTLTAPGRQVVLLSDEAFFIRSVPLSTAPEAASVASQVELALESLAPFPVTQLYYGYWTKPGLDRVLVFAAYRKRFAPEDLATWDGADLVLPRFTMLLGTPAIEPATAWVLTTAEGLTGVYFGEASGVPTVVRTIPLGENADVGGLQIARDQLLRVLGPTRNVIDVPGVDVQPGEAGEGAFEAVAGPLRSELSLTQAEALDVRDKGELASRRTARVRDRWMWRGVLAGVLIIALSALAELAIVGMQAWQRTRLDRIAQQTPVVTQVMTAQTLATRIEELSTRRLRPFEMIEAVSVTKPDSIQFISTTTSGLYTLEVQAQATSQNDIDQYRNALNALDSTDRVQVEVQRTQNNITTFRMLVTFSPTAFTTPAGGITP